MSHNVTFVLLRCVKFWNWCRAKVRRPPPILSTFSTKPMMPSLTFDLGSRTLITNLQNLFSNYQWLTQTQVSRMGILVQCYRDKH